MHTSAMFYPRPRSLWPALFLLLAVHAAGLHFAAGSRFVDEELLFARETENDAGTEETIADPAAARPAPGESPPSPRDSAAAAREPGGKRPVGEGAPDERADQSRTRRRALREAGPAQERAGPARAASGARVVEKASATEAARRTKRLSRKKPTPAAADPEQRGAGGDSAATPAQQGARGGTRVQRWTVTLRLVSAYILLGNGYTVYGDCWA